MKQPPLTLISGERESGKTSLCASILAAYHKQAGDLAQASGVLSPAVIVDGVKTGIDALSVASGERRPLARLRSESSHGLMTQNWDFEEATIDWVNSLLRETGETELLIVDELGPLELARGEGFMAAIPMLQTGSYRMALAVVRSELLPSARKILPVSGVIEIRRLAEVESAVRELLAKLTGGANP
ncbi:MAG: nucleoside-triphosphatase [Anaerolineales bacterium]|jgi:nucleoside-triphosphatase THEP1